MSGAMTVPNYARLYRLAIELRDREMLDRLGQYRFDDRGVHPIGKGQSVEGKASGPRSMLPALSVRP